MSDKRYDQIQSGTPDSSKIILYADESTGELFKTPISGLPAPTSYILFAKSHYVNANNSGSNPQTISQITIPANTITAQGQWIEWDVFFEFITGSGTKTVEIRVDGNAVTNLNGTTVFNPWFKIKAIYNGSNQWLFSVQSRSNNTNLTSTAWGTTAFNPTSNRNLDIVVTAGAVNSITMRYQTVMIGAN